MAFSLLLPSLLTFLLALLVIDGISKKSINSFFPFATLNFNFKDPKAGDLSEEEGTFVVYV
jgi:hypothetical protein